MIRHCRVCSTQLHLNQNWNPSHAATRQYACKACYQIKNAKRMSVDHAYVSMEHPLHKPGRYRSFTDMAFNSIVRKERSMEGYVYLLTNPAYPHWVKVGCAIDVDDREDSYQTSSPFRDYTVIAHQFVEDRRDYEQDLIEYMEAISEDRRNEWFCIPAESALEAFDAWRDSVCV